MRHVTDLPVVRKHYVFNTLPLWSRLTGLVLLALPLQGFTEEGTQYDRIISKKVVKVASVAGDSTHFQKDGFLHGFGHDLTRAYAEQLNVKLEFKTFKSTKSALAAVKAGKVDFALTTASTEQMNQHELASLDLTCGQPDLLKRYGLNPQVNWTFKQADDPIVSSANGFICQEHQLGVTKQLAAFYDQNMMRNQVERSSLKAALETRLPQYLDSIQANAKQYKLDWHLLTAIGYQESHLKSDAISPTGVTGLMMLTQATAAEMGVVDRTDPMQSIQGGAKYFGQLLKQYPKASKSDRVWFALVAYNMGPNALEQVRNKVKKKGQDPNVWADVYQLMSDQAIKNASYRQAVHYVTRIRAYLETIKQDRKLSRL